MLYPLARRVLFRLPPERAHAVSMRALHATAGLPGVGATLARALRPRPLPTEVLGLRFANPVGLAAGFDKNAEHVAALAALGFGFIEVGSVTARPWPGNPPPRLFRLPADRALINRMGLNNHGADVVAGRLMALRGHAPVPVFVNIAKTPDPALEGPTAVADYLAAVRRLKSFADALVLNVSCPNTGDGRTFEHPDALRPLLEAVLTDVDGLCPVLVKLSPDLPEPTLRAAVRLATDLGVAGFTATNTTTARDGLRTPAADLAAIGRGGLSGAPLHPRALHAVRVIREETDRPIVGVGGITGPAEARAFLDAGAALVQVYTGFIYGGPGTVRRICAGLAASASR